jgi:acid phosphatase
VQNYEVIANTTSFTKFQKEGILLNNFNAVRHPSFPNYIAAAAGSNLDIVDDDFHSFPANVTSIYDLLEKKGLSWKVYMEDLPYPGYNEQTNGEYARRHNPAICFDSIAQNPKRAANVVGGK